MGLLDMFGGGKPMDPAVAQGLLQAGLTMLQAKGNFGSALGQGGMAGTQAYMQQSEQARRRAYEDQMRMRQNKQFDRDDKLADLPQQFLKPPSLPALDATGGMETAVEAPNNASGPGGFDVKGYVEALKGIDPVRALQLEASLQKQVPQPVKLSQNERLLEPGTNRVLVDAMPDQAKEPEALRALKSVYGEGSPEYKAASRAYAQKLTTHSPAATITNYGSPVPVELPGGGVGYVQPTNRGGPVAPMVTPGGQPLRKPEDKTKDLTESQAKAATYLGQMRSATKTLQDAGADQTALSVQAETALAGGPMNAAIGQKAQRVRQSQDQWSEAFLRFKTGAASTKDEVAANRKTFFPIFGDRPEQVEQKKAMRAQAEADMEIAAGRGAGQLNARDGKAKSVIRFDAQGNMVP